MRFLARTFLCLSLGVGCKEPGSPKTIGEFATKHLELYAKRVADCSARDEEALLGLLQINDYQTKIEHAAKQKRVVYDRQQADKCLQALASASCSDLGAPFATDTGACTLAVAGQVKLGDDCFEFSDFNECKSPNFCVPGSDCAGICTAVVNVGGSCGAGTLCAPGTQCLNNACRRQGDLRATCLGNTKLTCRSPYICLGGDDTKTGTCSSRLTEGACRNDQSGDHGDCDIGYQCAFNDDLSTTCAKSLGSGAPCAPGRNQCAAFLACVKGKSGAYSCTTFAHEGETCGYYASGPGQVTYESYQCLGSWCEIPADGNQTPHDMTGTCKALLGAGEVCDPQSLQCADGLSCDSISGTCVAGCPLQ